MTSTGEISPETVPRQGGSALPSTVPTGALPSTTLSTTGLTSFEWDTLAGTISTDPMGPRLRGWPPPRTRRPEQDFLAEISPAQAESVRLRARAAQATGQPLDVQMWVPRSAGSPRLLWMHGVREPTSDSAAPLIGAVIDITDIARSLKVASASDTPSSVDPTRVGRFTWDQTSHVIQLSPEAAAIIGVDGAGAHTQAEFDRLALPEDVAELSRQVRHAMPGDILDLGIRVDDGDVRRSLHLRAIASAGDAGGLALIGTIQDVDDEAAARQAVVNVTRALNTLSHATKALNTAPDEQTLIEDVCRTVVRDGGYHFAWYGRKEDDAGRTVTPVASAGYEDGYLDELRFSWDAHDPAGGGPTGQAIRTGEVRFAHLHATHPGFDLWRKAALDRGFVSSVALPVRVDGAVEGALMVYATEATAFDAAEIGLLEDLARDLGYGLRRLLGTRELVETTHAAQATSQRLQATLNSLLDPFVLLEAVRDADGTLVDLRYVEANDAAATYNQVRREDFLGRTVLELLPGHLDHGPMGLYVKAIESGEPVILDDFPYFNEVRGEMRRTDLRAVRCGDGIALTWRDVTDRFSAQRRIAESEQRYRLLAENSSDVVYLLDEDRRITWVSPSITQSTGWLPEDLVGRLQSGLVHSEDHARVTEAFTASGDQPRAVDFRLRQADGTYSWFSATARWATDDAGSVAGLVVGLRDIDAQVAAERELADREERYRLLSENASDVVLQIGSDGRIRWASESISSVLGWPGHDVLGRVATELVHPDDRPDAIAGLLEAETGAGLNGRMRILREDGTHQWMAVTVHRVQTADANFRIIALRDIQEAVHAQVELEHAIGHDPLTGLATRSATITRLQHLLERLPSDDASVAVLCVGVDGLKTVNEALTHEAGDHLVAVLATRIAACVDHDDLVGRGTGDEFLVLVPDLADRADASIVAEHVRLAAQGLVLIGAHRLEPTVSIGVASGTRSADAEDLLRDASLAMRQAKANGRNRAEFVDPQLANEAQRRLLVDGAVRDALRDGELVPWFQPIVRLADSGLVGYEALVRWVRPDGSIVEPAAFLPVAERSSLITEIDLAILERAVATLAAADDPLFVAVNVSAATLAEPDYADRVLELLTAAGLEPSRLHLEITETAVLRITAAVRASMDRLDAVGVRWYMDDFGTGYSSITHLRDLPISGMKLDRSFTQGIGDAEGTAEQLARALGGLAHGLGLDTVAEGVETEDEAAVLASHGWVHGQGWFYGRAAPLPAP